MYKELDNNGMGVTLMQEGEMYAVYNIIGRCILRTESKQHAVNLLEYYKRQAHAVFKDFKVMQYSGSVHDYWEGE